MYTLDVRGGSHNGHPVFVHVRGHEFVYRTDEGYWMIAPSRSWFLRNKGQVGTIKPGFFSPTVAASGGWDVYNGTAWVQCAGVAVTAISGAFDYAVAL